MQTFPENWVLTTILSGLEDDQMFFVPYHQTCIKRAIRRFHCLLCFFFFVLLKMFPRLLFFIFFLYLKVGVERVDELCLLAA